MKPLKFELVEKSRAGKVFLVLAFEGGDSDTQHPQEIELTSTFEQLDLEEVQRFFHDYKTLQYILDDSATNYQNVEEQYGPVLARLYDQAPNDPQADYQFKCYLSDIFLVGYDLQGNKYKTYLQED